MRFRRSPAASCRYLGGPSLAPIGTSRAVGARFAATAGLPDRPARSVDGQAAARASLSGSDRTSRGRRMARDRAAAVKTTKSLQNADVAQLVEHFTRNDSLHGSRRWRRLPCGVRKRQKRRSFRRPAVCPRAPKKSHTWTSWSLCLQPGCSLVSSTPAASVAPATGSAPGGSGARDWDRASQFETSLPEFPNDRGSSTPSSAPATSRPRVIPSVAGIANRAGAHRQGALARNGFGPIRGETQRQPRGGCDRRRLCDHVVAAPVGSRSTCGSGLSSPTARGTRCLLTTC